MTKNQALHLALEYVELVPDDRYNADHIDRDALITAIKTTLEAKDEPVAWISPTELLVMRGNALGGAKDWRVNVGLKPEDGDVGLYTTPPQRTWVGLTDEEIKQNYRLKCKEFSHWFDERAFLIACGWAEAKLKEKNT